MESIILKGDPKSTQNVYRVACTGRFPRMYMSDIGKSIKEDYQLQLKSQWKKKPLKKELSVTIRLYFKQNRKHDVDNFNKIILDSLTGIVWEDDSQIMEILIQKYLDKDDPRAEIDITETL